MLQYTYSQSRNYRMITLNGKRYAHTKEEFLKTLFKPVNGKTADGYIKKSSESYIVLDEQDNILFGVKWVPMLQRPMLVDCKKVNGKYEFGKSNSLTEAQKELIGLNDIRHNYKLASDFVDFMINQY